MSHTPNAPYIPDTPDLDNWLCSWFCHHRWPPMAQVISAFVYGLLLSPWSSGIFWLALIIIVIELLTYIFTCGHSRYYNVFVRAAVICATVLGYFCGRTLSGDVVIFGEPPNFCEDPENCPI